MHRNRTWQIDPEELRTQRNRILPIEGGDGSTLSLDFTGGVLDPRLTFNRSSNATFINSRGYVQYANANMMRHSENCGSWSGAQNITPTADAAIAPNGTQTADQLNLLASSYRYQVTANTNAVSQPYVASIWMRTVSGTASVGFRIANTTTGSNSAIATCSVTETWQRFNTPAFTLTDTANRTIDVGVDQRSIVSGPNVAANIYVWGLQVQPGTSVGEYLPTTTTEEFDTPRFDYDPTTLAARGLLLEGSATNYVLRSDVTGFPSPWSTAGTTLPTITAGYTGGGFSPDGITYPTRVQFGVNSGGSASRLLQATSYATNPTTANPYTVSVWMKSNTAGTNYTINIYGTTGNNSVTVTPTWQRFQIVNTSGTSLVGYIYISNESTSIAADVSIWGVQLEAGNGASSYIPTGASTGTRTEDLCVMDNITSLQYSTTNGSMYYEGRFSKLNTSSFPWRMGFTTESGDHRVFGLLTNSGGSGIEAKGPSSTPTATVNVSLALNTDYKLAWSMDTALATGEVRRSSNGGAVSVSSASALTVTGTPTYFMFGQKGYGAFFPAGTIKAAKYWPTTLPDAQLQAITA